MCGTGYELSAHSLVLMPVFPELSLDYITVSSKTKMLPEAIMARKGEVAWEKSIFGCLFHFSPVYSGQKKHFSKQ